MVMMKVSSHETKTSSQSVHACPVSPASGKPCFPHKDNHRAGHDPVSQRRNKFFLPRIHDVQWALTPGVGRPPPTPRRALLNLEIQWLVVPVDHDVQVAVTLRCAMQAIGNAARLKRKVDGGTDPIPADIVAPK